jgi:hypothetical protein
VAIKDLPAACAARSVPIVVVIWSRSLTQRRAGWRKRPAFNESKSQAIQLAGDCPSKPQG